MTKTDLRRKLIQAFVDLHNRELDVAALFTDPFGRQRAAYERTVDSDGYAQQLRRRFVNVRTRYELAQ